MLRKREACVPPSLLSRVQKGNLERQNQSNGKHGDAVTFISVRHTSLVARLQQQCTAVASRELEVLPLGCKAKQSCSLACQHCYWISSLGHIFICTRDFHTFPLSSIFFRGSTLMTSLDWTKRFYWWLSSGNKNMQNSEFVYFSPKSGKHMKQMLVHPFGGCWREKVVSVFSYASSSTLYPCE